MSHASSLAVSHSRAGGHHHGDFSPRFRPHSRHVERPRDSFVQFRKRPAVSDVFADQQSFSASSLSASLRASSHTVERHNGDTGNTVVVQRDRLDLRLNASSLSVQSGDVEDIASALQGQTDALVRVLDAAGLLGSFNSELSGEFLSRVRSGLEGAAADSGLQYDASRLDLKISVRTKTVRSDNEDGAVFERTVQRIDVRVRFVALSFSGEVRDAQQPIDANIADGQAQLQGLGPFQQFDLNGDGQFTSEDIIALADEVLHSDES